MCPLLSLIYPMSPTLLASLLQHWLKWNVLFLPMWICIIFFPCGYIWQYDYGWWLAMIFFSSMIIIYSMYNNNILYVSNKKNSFILMDVPVWVWYLQTQHALRLCIFLFSVIISHGHSNASPNISVPTQCPPWSQVYYISLSHPLYPNICWLSLCLWVLLDENGFWRFWLEN